MRINGIVLVITTILAFLISSCTSGSNLTGGNSSETTNTALTSNGTPAGFAKVKLIDAKNWAYLVSNKLSPVIDSATADKNGKFSFNELPDHLCNLQIDHDSSGVVIKSYCQSGRVSLTTDTIKLEGYAAFQGKCVSNDQISADSVYLAGTAYRESINSNQLFTIKNIAPGDYPVFIHSNSGPIAITNALSFKAGEILKTDSLAVSFSQLLIDDFNDSNMVSIPGQITGGTWYCFVDSMVGGSSSIVQNIVQGRFASDNAMKAEMVLMPKAEGPWAGIGVLIGSSSDEWDFSSLKGITFMAKGKGIFRVSIESAVIDSMNVWPNFGAVFTVDTVWRQYKIPVDSLVLIENSSAAQSGITWKQVSSRIQNIEFEASTANAFGDTLQLWLDDIYIDGISSLELVNKKR